MAKSGNGARSQVVLVPDQRDRRVEERFRQVVECAPNAMVLINQNGLIDLVNAEAERVFGYSRAEMLGQKIEMLLPERYRQKHAGHRLAFMAASESRPMAARRDLFALKKDVSEFPVEIGLNPIETDDGPMVLAAIVDISERKQAESDRERQAAELRRSNAELAQFAHVASHDLKAPLRAIQNLAAWIDEDLGPGASEETRENLALLRRRGERLEKLLSGLTEFALVDRNESRPQRVDTAELVAGIAEYITPPPGFSVSCRGEMPVLYTSKVALEHVFQNLINNALRHHDRAGGTVIVTARDLGDKFEFAVQDDGPGVDPAFQERIFVVFQTLEPCNEAEGSGVGLTIAKKIVELRGGTIRVESAPPRRGAAFIFTWPRATA